MWSSYAAYIYQNIKKMYLLLYTVPPVARMPFEEQICICNKWIWKMWDIWLVFSGENSWEIVMSQSE